MSAPALAFLLGVPRSGTTLLAQLLRAHPDVSAPPEPWLLLALESFGRTPARHPADSQLLALATEELLSRVEAHRALRALADDVYAQYRQRSGAGCLVDKTPRYWLVLDFLESLYPQAPALVLLRNPYAIAASLKTSWGIRLSADAGPGPQAPYLADLVLGLEALREHAERRSLPVLRYEALVGAPADEQARALAHLGRGADALAEPGVPLADGAERTSFGDTKIRARRTVDPSSLDAWQGRLGRDELQAVTELLGPELIIRLGYGDALDTAIRLGARPPSRERSAARRRQWTRWLAVNRAVVAHAAAWPAAGGDPGERIEHLEAQAAEYRQWALNSERLLAESNDDRRQLRAWAEDAERRASR